ncbi:hypothetical protein NW760_015429 [Fusarium oxysporum]|nr:hypothetical protein NW769_015395 [Fusarium oxysporum]KAJ4211934.1 hypothetical protein NW760_015429 [Fusarium oxysporum]
MKTAAFLSALTMAVVAIAAPAEIESLGGSGGTCNSNNHQQVCCNGGGLLGLACTVGILSTGCNQGTYCCETGSAVGGLINIDALLKNYRQKRIAFPVFDQSSSSILAPYFHGGNALRFSNCTNV